MRGNILRSLRVVEFGGTTSFETSRQKVLTILVQKLACRVYKELLPTDITLDEFGTAGPGAARFFLFSPATVLLRVPTSDFLVAAMAGVRMLQCGGNS